MKLKTRKIVNNSFTGISAMSIILMAGALLIVLIPIFSRGMSAFIFKGTIEFRELNFQQFQRGDKAEIELDSEKAEKARQPVYTMLDNFSKELSENKCSNSDSLYSHFEEVKGAVRELLGPRKGESRPVLMRDQYGKTRWDKAEHKLKEILFREAWDYSDKNSMGKKIFVSRKKDFKATSLEPMFDYFEQNIERMLLPRRTFYWRFLFDTSFDSHFFGGIWPEVLGTFYLVLLTMLFAVPTGIISAVYLTEFATNTKIVSFLRICISTLAGVPSIVFGLFGLAFFINTVKISDSKSVLAGALTLALLILPTIIRASEEAILAVPRTYKEASLSLGAGKLKTVLSVILPSAMPGIITGIVISMGRAAGETAPIIFTAAVSVGKPLKLIETLSQPTPALSWNIYNLVSEHEAVEQIRHVQFGMVFTLVLLVLLLNLAAIILRARISKKLRG